MCKEALGWHSLPQLVSTILNTASVCGPYGGAMSVYPKLFRTASNNVEVCFASFSPKGIGEGNL